MTRVSPAARSRILDLVAAISLANLCLLLVWRELLYADSSDRYFMIEFTPRQYAAALLNLTWLSAMFYLGARAFRRTTSIAIRAALAAALALSMLAPLNYVRLALRFQENQLFALSDQSALLIVLLLGLSLLTVAMVRFWRTSLKVLYIVLLVFAPFAAMNVARSMWAVLTTSAVHAAAAPHTVRASYSGSRVVWLIFDELDWRLAFEQPPPTLQIPAFHRLMDQSIVAAARESSGATLRAIPALTTGQTVRDARGLDSRHNALSVSGQPDQSWDSVPNVFSDAHSRGAHTAIVGFYHPYCRIFAGDYDSCMALPLDVAHMDPDESIPTTMVAELARLTPMGRRISAVRMYTALLAQTTTAAANPDVDFLFAHVSVPHGPNIWEPSGSRFDYLRLRRDAYFDNVVLADRFLASVRSAMEAAGVWDRTLVVVTSDHGWRHSDLIGEKRDRRVPLIVKASGQTTRVDIASALAPASARSVVLTGFSGRSTDSARIASMLERFVQPLPPAAPAMRAAKF